MWLTSFLLVATNTAVAAVILHRDVARRAITLGVALVCAGVGPVWFVLSPAPPVGPTVRVALVQPGDIADSAARQAASEMLTATLAGQHPRAARRRSLLWGMALDGYRPDRWDITGAMILPGRCWRHHVRGRRGYLESIAVW